MKYFARTLAVCLALLFAASSAFAMSSRRPAGPTLVILPERYSVMQVAFDLASKRDVILVSYRGDLESPELHAWSGSEWVRIPFAQFEDVSFLRIVPRETVLVGDEETLPPKVKESVRAWCPKVWLAESAQTGELVNSFGRVFRFGNDEWQWFAKRYNLEISDINEERRKSSWYFHPFVEHRGGLPAPVEDATNAYEDEMVEPPAEPARPRLSLPMPADADLDAQPGEM